MDNVEGALIAIYIQLYQSKRGSHEMDITWFSCRGVSSSRYPVNYFRFKCIQQHDVLWAVFIDDSSGGNNQQFVLK